jgi:polysaccharide deacetylase family protein (PEP-CTERM system associated)
MIMLNALTIDVEDYFHVMAFSGRINPADWDQYPKRVETNTNRLLEILAERETLATFFVLGWVAERCPGLVRRIKESGHSVGCHGYWHQAIYKGDQEDFRSDVRRAKFAIENLLGYPVTSYRAPSYSINARTPWALTILAEEGFECDSSIFPVNHDLYGIPDAPRFPHVKILSNGKSIKEFPPSTLRLCGTNLPIAGGGYLRLLPYSWTAAAIRALNDREKRPVMVYVHPWEIDPDQPRISSSWRSRFRHYQNLATTENKIINLLSDFSFSTMEQVLAGLDLDPNFVLTGAQPLVGAS